MSYFLASVASLCSAAATLFCDPTAYTTSWQSRLPCLSRHTTLHPVRIPGSTPMTRFCPSGAASSSCRRFSAKTPIASSSAFCFDAAANSFSIEGSSRRLQASLTASPMMSAQRPLDLTKMPLTRSAASSPSTLMLTRSTPSLSPRRMASRRLPVQRRRGSSASK